MSYDITIVTEKMLRQNDSNQVFYLPSSMRIALYFVCTSLGGLKYP